MIYKVNEHNTILEDLTIKKNALKITRIRVVDNMSQVTKIQCELVNKQQQISNLSA